MESTPNTLQRINLDKSQPILRTSSNSVSVYGQGTITQAKAIKETEKILIAFPKIEPAMLKLLRERFKENGFTDKRMEDSVNHVIDNYTGFDKLPSIGDFIKFDKKVEVLTTLELTEKANKMGVGIRNDYTCADIDGKPYYIKNKDFTDYGFKKWQPKTDFHQSITKIEIPKEDREKTASILRDAINSLELK